MQQLIADYQDLLDLAQQATRRNSQLQELLGQVKGSRSWRLTAALRRVQARLSGRAYVDPLAALAPQLPVNLPTRAGFPRLPDMPELGLRGRAEVEVKRWANTRFLGHHFYDQLPQLLRSRAPDPGRIFVQAPIIDWFVPLFQRPQHMARAMARQGYLVFYMTANTLGDRANGFHEIEPNVFITNQPVHLMVSDALVSCYSTVATLLSWYPDELAKVRGRGNRILYEYIDHIDPEISFGTTDTLRQQLERVGPKTVDLVLASARALQQELRDRGDLPEPVYVPNGVDVDHFRSAAAAPMDRAQAPEVLRKALGTGRPVVGYFGALAPWLWYPMINELTARRPDLEFVFIGPDYLGGMAQIERRANVHLTGAVDYTHLPAHARYFDMAIVPFKPGDIARTTSPLKLFEYFALEKPVVVTDSMAECVQFDEVFGAGDVDGFSRAIDDALAAAGDPVVRAAYARLADSNRWEERARVLDRAWQEHLTVTQRAQAPGAMDGR